MKKASEIFHEVDPNLKVVEGHRHKRLTRKDWDNAGGAKCPRCNQEAVKFRGDGVCIQCAQVLNEKQDRDDKKRAKQLKFIKQHNARITKKRGAKFK